MCYQLLYNHLKFIFIQLSGLICNALGNSFEIVHLIYGDILENLVNLPFSVHSELS